MFNLYIIYLLFFYNICCTRTVKYVCELVKEFVYETFTDEVIKYLLSKGFLC